MGEAAAEKDFYWKLFKSTFIISAFTIGGGFVIIPLLKAKFVDEYKWMDDKEALNLVAIAQSAPGVVAFFFTNSRWGSRGRVLCQPMRQLAWATSLAVSAVRLLLCWQLFCRR